MFQFASSFLHHEDEPESAADAVPLLRCLRRTKTSAEAKDEPTPDYKQRYGATKDLYAASSAAAMAAAASKAETRRALDRIVATHAQAHGLGGKAPITREAMEAGLRRNTIVRKASITQGDRVQLKGEEGGAADVNSR